MTRKQPSLNIWRKRCAVEVETRPRWAEWLYGVDRDTGSVKLASRRGLGEYHLNQGAVRTWVSTGGIRVSPCWQAHFCSIPSRGFKKKHTPGLTRRQDRIPI
jgi:hypothetical protein